MPFINKGYDFLHRKPNLICILLIRMKWRVEHVVIDKHQTQTSVSTVVIIDV